MVIFSDSRQRESLLRNKKDVRLKQKPQEEPQRKRLPRKPQLRRRLKQNPGTPANLKTTEQMMTMKSLKITMNPKIMMSHMMKMEIRLKNLMRPLIRILMTRTMMKIMTM